MKVVLLLVLALLGEKPVVVQLEQPDVATCEKLAHKFMVTPLPKGATLRFKSATCAVGDPAKGADA